MPDVSGASAVNTGVHTHYHYAHTRLRVHWAPGNPRALFNEGERFSSKPRAKARRENANACVCRHCEERLRRSNPVLSFAARWIASLTLAMTLLQRRLLFDS